MTTFKLKRIFVKNFLYFFLILFGTTYSIGQKSTSLESKSSYTEQVQLYSDIGVVKNIENIEYRENIAYKGVRVNNGMLAFDSEEVMKAIYKDLQGRCKEYSYLKRGEIKVPEWEDDPILLDFERKFKGYTSLRYLDLLEEEEFLARGGDPKDLEENELTIDAVLASFINSKKQFQIGRSKYYIAHDDLIYQVKDGNMRTLEELAKGKNPYLFPNVTIVKPPPSDCKASFGVNGATEGLDYSFTFTGHPTPISHPDAVINYHWTFGDGSTSTEQNPSHSYSAGGEFEICVVVEMMSKDSSYCTDRACKSITVTETTPQDTTVTCYGAALFLWNETGVPGEICFTPIAGNWGSNIVSYSWTFGDGNTSNVQNACNIWTCDLDNVIVSLTVELENGCKQTHTLPVNITSYSCCEKKAKSKGTEHYADKYKFKWLQKNTFFIGDWGRDIKVRLKHYKKNSWRWKRNKAKLKVCSYGDVYTESAEGCGCSNDYDVSGCEVDYNSSKVVLHKGVTHKYKTRKGWEWSAKYYVNDVLHLDHKTGVACD